MISFLEKMAEKHPDLKICLADIQQAYDLLEASFRRGGKLLLCGNGGSAADSEHIVGELMKGYLLKRPLPDALRRKLLEENPHTGEYLADHLQGALPAISLASQSALMTAFSNDVAADMAFAQQVYGYGQPGDVLLGISTSGNSKNILNALRVGRALGLHTIGLTGQSGGEMIGICDVTICAPAQDTPDVQEKHIAIYHALCAMLETTFFTQENDKPDEQRLVK